SPSGSPGPPCSESSTGSTRAIAIDIPAPRTPTSARRFPLSSIEIHVEQPDILLTRMHVPLLHPALRRGTGVGYLDHGQIFDRDGLHHRRIGTVKACEQIGRQRRTRMIFPVALGPIEE